MSSIKFLVSISSIEIRKLYGVQLNVNYLLSSILIDRLINRYDNVESMIMSLYETFSEYKYELSEIFTEKSVTRLHVY